MPTLDQLTISERHSVCLYGGPKTSKTLIAGKLAELYTLHYFDFENGIKTLKSAFSKEEYGCKKEWMKNVFAYSIKDTREDPVAVDTITKVLSGNAVRLCADHGKVACPYCLDTKTGQLKPGKLIETIELNKLDVRKDIVVIDSGTQWALSAINHVCRGKTIDYKQDWDDWRKQGNLLTLGLLAIQAGAYNCIFITHEMLINMEDGRDKICPTFGTREHSKTTAKYFDHVVYADIRNSRHVFSSTTTAIPNVVSGSRSSVDLEKEPEKLLKAIFAGYVEKENQLQDIKLQLTK